MLVCPQQAEIDRTLKRVQEGIDDFDDIWKKVQTPCCASTSVPTRRDADRSFDCARAGIRPRHEHKSEGKVRGGPEEGNQEAAAIS